MEITLLSAEDLWGDDALEILKEDAMKTASLSDLAVLLGGKQFLDVCAADGLPSGWLWTSSKDKYEDIKAVTKGSVTGWACTSWRDLSIRPIIRASEANRIPKNKIKQNGMFKGVETVLYGQFPQTMADNQDELEALYKAKKLKKTGKSYEFDCADTDDYEMPYKAKSYAEYTHNGEKFIRIRSKIEHTDKSLLSNGERVMQWQPYFIKVEPIEWLKDKSGALVSKKALAAGFPFDTKETYKGCFEKTGMHRRLKRIGDEMEPVYEEINIQNDQMKNRNKNKKIERILKYKESVIRAKTSEKIKNKYISNKKQKD